MPRPLTPIQRQNIAQTKTGYGPIHLYRVGNKVRVALARDGQSDFITVIEEDLDSNFSHIIEPLGIQEAFEGK